MIYNNNYVEPENFGTYSIVIQNSGPPNEQQINQNFTIKHQGFQPNSSYTPQFNSELINDYQQISIPPRIKSGIYRKDSNPNLLIASQNIASNVIISNGESYGKILQSNDTNADGQFHNDKNHMIVQNYPTHDKLSILAYDVLKLHERNLTIDRDKNRILSRNPITNQKIIYKLFTPESLGLIENKSTVPKKPNKRKLIKKKKKNMMQNKQIEKLKIIKHSKTRSGRIIKPPQYINNLQNHNGPTEINNIENKSKKIKKIIKDLKDRDYKYNSSKPIALKYDLPIVEEKVENIPKRIRKLSPDSQCPVCNKILLGKRMKKHFLQYPDHNIKSQQINSFENPTEIYDMSLFKFLVNKVKIQPECDDRTDLLLNEIGDLVEQLQSRSSKLVRNTSGIHFVNSRSAKILGIPEGQYSLDVNAIDAQPDPIQLDDIQTLGPPPPPRLDYNLSISLDDTITAKLNLSDNIIPSEESLLRTVDDLVQEGMKKLGEHNNDDDDDSVLHHSNVNEPIIHYDHVNDNAVEAVSMKEITTKCPPILDLSLDLFQFNSN